MNYLALLQLIIGAGLTLYYGAFLLAMCVILSVYRICGGKWRGLVKMKSLSDWLFVSGIVVAIAAIMIGVINIHAGYHNVWQN